MLGDELSVIDTSQGFDFYYVKNAANYYLHRPVKDRFRPGGVGGF